MTLPAMTRMTFCCRKVTRSSIGSWRTANYASGNVVSNNTDGFSVVGTGDYNGDGTSDILLQKGGTVVDWIMKDGAYQSGNVLTTAASGWTVAHS